MEAVLDAIQIAIVFLAFGPFLIWFILWIYILLPASMARLRGRSQLGWVLVSLIISPLFAIVLLWLLGKSRR